MDVIKEKRDIYELVDQFAMDSRPATAGDIRALNERLDRIEQLLRSNQSIHDWAGKQLSPYLRERACGKGNEQT